MANVRKTSTSTEIAIRNLIDDLSISFRTGARDLPGSPDIVNDERRWAIFVNGCFWHAHAGCKYWTIPRSNRAFWRKKFRDNRARDQRKENELKSLGYSVLVVWQCELKDVETLKTSLLNFCRSSTDVGSKSSAVLHAL